MKKWMLVGLMLGLCLLLGACAQTPREEAAIRRPCAEIVDAVIAGQSFEEMTMLEQSQIIKYLDLGEDTLADAAMALDASRATAEMVLVLAAKDDAGVKALQEALEAYRDSTLEQYRDYRPEEAPKLEAAVLETKGVQTALIVSADSAAAKKSLTEAWK